MNIRDMTKLALSLIGKGEVISEIVHDIIDLYRKIQTELPGVIDQFKAAASGTQATTDAYSIEWLQQSLNKLGADLKVDGSYGKATQDAVKAFQAKHGLTADGWAGALTQAAIIEAIK